jgi:uncharacterized membrane protein YkoI
MKQLVLLLFMSFLASPATADDGRGHGGSHDHDRARDAVAHHDARRLADILPAIERRYGARMVEVEFEAEGGRFVYKIELITTSGRIVEVEVDAATGAIVRDDIGDDTHEEPED